MHRGNSGFTLLEVLVALTILAISAAAISSGLSQSLRQSQSLEDKTFASFVADNKMTEMHAGRLWPELGENRQVFTMAGRDWQVDVMVKPTAEQNMRQVAVMVSKSDKANAAPLVTLTGDLGKY